MTHSLIVRLLPSEDGHRFLVTRASDQKDADPVTVPSPVGFGVEGSPDTELMRELRWYLESFLNYPYSPQTERAARVRQALRSWGRQAFEALFGHKRSRDFYRDATRRHGLSGLRVEVRGDDPQVLAWPWEALEDEDAMPLALGCQLERRLNRLSDPLRLPDDLPRDHINILLVIARPFQGDVPYRSIARPLVELVENEGLPAHITVLRPPTLRRLQEVLAEAPGRFHLLHFDGHGSYSEASPATERVSPYKQQAAVGRLIFENVEGGPDPVDAAKLGTLLREYRLPAVVLNACQSGMVDQRADDVFASVATAMLKGGVRSVVAMAYSLYVSGAKHFLQAFYQSLFDEGEVGRAVQLGRRRMYEEPGRVCALGTHELSDWVVPVLYQQEKLDLSFAARRPATKETGRRPRLPEEAEDNANPYGFIGRDSVLLELERAMRRPPAGILIQGLGGVGKTTLARGFLKWLSQTRAPVAGWIWTDFSEVRSAEFVVNQLVAPLFGTHAFAASMKEKVRNVSRSLFENPLVIVWDNFESARGIKGSAIKGLLTAEDLEWLCQLMERLRGGKTKIILTSRSEEAWLGPSNRFKLSIGGLCGEERWEFCQHVLRDLGQSPERSDPGLVELMDALGGHPLMMRAVLPKLESMSALAILKAVRENLASLSPTGDRLYDQLIATLIFVEESLPRELKPFLIPLSLHERYVVAEDLAAMAAGVQGAYDLTRIEQFLVTLTSAGLTRSLAPNIYVLHPALTGFLNTRVPEHSKRERWKHAFVERMAHAANFHRSKARLHGSPAVIVYSANFHAALSIAAQFPTSQHCVPIAQFLGGHALTTRALGDAERLYTQLAHYGKRDRNPQAEAFAYHRLGQVAKERRDFARAEQFHAKSLTIRESSGDEEGIADDYHQLGMIAQERRDFAGAEAYYLKALDITQRLGDETAIAADYHQLGRLAEGRQELAKAESWYHKALVLNESVGNEDDAAKTCHQLGRIYELRKNLAEAERWYLRSLETKEKLGDEHGASKTHHQLGMVAQERGDFSAAERYYLRSLAICDKLGDEHGVLLTCGQLGIVSRQRGDLSGAEKWYMKSLRISQSMGDDHSTAMTWGELGSLEASRGNLEAAASWFIRAFRAFVRCNDKQQADRNKRNFVRILQASPDQLRPRIRAMWEEAGSPSLPTDKAH